jgi:hypothetical protein
MELSRKSSSKIKRTPAHVLVLTTINSGDRPKTCDGFDIIDRSEALDYEVHGEERGKGGGGGGADSSAARAAAAAAADDDDDDSAQIVSLVDSVRTKVSIRFFPIIPRIPLLNIYENIVMFSVEIFMWSWNIL